MCYFGLRVYIGVYYCVETVMTAQTQYDQEHNSELEDSEHMKLCKPSTGLHQLFG